MYIIPKDVILVYQKISQFYQKSGLGEVTKKWHTRMLTPVKSYLVSTVFTKE